ncbi:MAG: hypothetical protein SGPRY_014880, partial [Prymnesium sp.]
MGSKDCSVFVRNLPYGATDASLEDHFSHVGPVKGAWIACDKKTKQSRGFGFVTFALPDDVARAISTMSGSVMGGRKITVDSAKKGAEAKAAAPHPSHASSRKQAGGAEGGEGRPAAAGAAGEGGEASVPPLPSSSSLKKKHASQASGKQHRMIVRNLSFKCDEAALRAAFEPYGSVVDVKVPMREGGKHPGFGFVQMGGAGECRTAMGAMNESTILGRIVAVDFAIEKGRFEKQNGEGEDGRGGENSQSKGVEVEGGLKGVQQTPADVVGEEYEEEAAESEEESGGGGEGEQSEEGEEEGGEVEGEEGGEESNEEEGEEENGGEQGEGQPTDSDDKGESASAKAALAAEELRRTVFVRSLPIEAGETHLSSKFQSFGKVRYARVVRDAATKLSRGTAFVCFAEEAAAERAAQQKQVCERSQGGVGSLGLGDEPAAAAMSLTERRRREDAWKAKKEKLKSTNFVISPTRLSVRNLPPLIDEAALRAVAIKAASSAKGAGPAKLKQESRFTL